MCFDKKPFVDTPPLIIIPSKPRAQINIDVKNSRKWTGVVWHHSDQVDHPGINDFNGIVKFHTSYRIDYNIVTKDEFDTKFKLEPTKHKFEKPWRYVGYNGVVERVDNKLVYNYGRPISTTGSHAGIPGNSTFNDSYLGFCVCGNYDIYTPDSEIMDFMLAITRSYMDAFNIKVENVIGHREVYVKAKVPVEKSCPGKLFNMNTFRGDL